MAIDKIVKTVKTTVTTQAFRESSAFSAAEVVSMGTSMVVVGAVGAVDALAPNLVKDTSKLIGKYCVEPVLEPLETVLSTVCRLEECKIDKSKSKEERAEALARTSLVFAAAWAASMGVKIYARAKFNSLMGVHDPDAPKPTGNWVMDQVRTFTHGVHSQKSKDILVADEAVHYGSLLAMNTVAAPLTDSMINGLTGILTKCGVSEKNAREFSSFAVIWELPNALGLAAGLSAMHSHNKTSNVERLMKQRQSAGAVEAMLHT